METYKKGQGVIVRRAAFFAVAALIVWGGQALYTFLINAHNFFKKALVGGEGADGFVIPVLEQRIDVAFLISWGVSILGVFVLYRLLMKPKTSDFLIETDDEMRKMTWPTWKDVWSSSMIVLMFVAILTTFLVATDFVIGRILGVIY